MKIQSTPNQVVPSVSPDLIYQDRGQLKQAIKDFLQAAAATPPVRLTCPRCGQPMRYVDTIFWLYGEERSFPIRLPQCPCAAEISELAQAAGDALSKLD